MVCIPVNDGREIVFGLIHRAGTFQSTLNTPRRGHWVEGQAAYQSTTAQDAEMPDR